ncbi:MAG: molybdenum cofactor guanylyltransferase [Oscillochloris sp.]|nr:molybdenum cofactor guanylyltransferase [Oscillochloris sp.]
MSKREIEAASAVVLAGGLSRRLGRDKRRLRLWGEHGPTLLEHTVATVASLCTDVVVVLNDPADWPDLPAQIVGDRYPDGGALGGIYSGVLAARAEYALVVACDMPLLHAPLLQAMLARKRDYDALVPRSPRPGDARNGLDLEPLHAIYAKRCLAPMQAALEAGRGGLSHSCRRFTLPTSIRQNRVVTIHTVTHSSISTRLSRWTRRAGCLHVILINRYRSPFPMILDF